MVLVPPFVDLRSVTSIVESERIPVGVGAQHVNANDAGAHTGEVSIAMLKRLNVNWVIVGHSERRANYAMSDDVVLATLGQVVRNGVRAVLCVGENLSVREEGSENDFVQAQIGQCPEGPRPEVPRTRERRLRAHLGDRYRTKRHQRTGARDMTTHIRSVLAGLAMPGSACSTGDR